MEPKTIALLFGGRSGEHEVSIRSAVSVADGLSFKHRVRPVFVDKAGRWLLQDGPVPRGEGGQEVFLPASPTERGRLRRAEDGKVLLEPDLYFPVLHGTFGEDGTVQGLLELACVPYVGAGVLSSAAAMDKEAMKALFAQAGLPQVAYRVLRGRDSAAEAEALQALGLPVFVKPANLGSSVAVSKVKSPEELSSALDLALAYDHKALVEQAAIGPREIEVSVLGNDVLEASLPGEIVPDREFYDYDSKYSENSRTELKVPAPLSGVEERTIRDLALRAFRAVDARGYARVDFFLEASGRVLLNEINTIPGFTSISMFPRLWEATGLCYPDLLERLLDLGLERHKGRSRLKTDYRP